MVVKKAAQQKAAEPVVEQQSGVPATFERYAIFQTGGKQYQAIEGRTVAIEKLDAEPGATITFDTVLFRKTADKKFEFGQPYLKTPIKASILKHDQGPKVVAFRFKRRKKTRVKQGHRQPLTVIRIESI